MQKVSNFFLFSQHMARLPQQNLHYPLHYSTPLFQAFSSILHMYTSLLLKPLHLYISHFSQVSK